MIVCMLCFGMDLKFCDIGMLMLCFLVLVISVCVIGCLVLCWIDVVM